MKSTDRTGQDLAHSDSAAARAPPAGGSHSFPIQIFSYGRGLCSVRIRPRRCKLWVRSVLHLEPRRREFEVRSSRTRAFPFDEGASSTVEDRKHYLMLTCLCPASTCGGPPPPCCIGMPPIGMGIIICWPPPYHQR